VPRGRWRDLNGCPRDRVPAAGWMCCSRPRTKSRSCPWRPDGCARQASPPRCRTSRRSPRYFDLVVAGQAGAGNVTAEIDTVPGAADPPHSRLADVLAEAGQLAVHPAQAGFSPASRSTRSRISWQVPGRPGRFGQVHLRVTRRRCQGQQSSRPDQPAVPQRGWQQPGKRRQDRAVSQVRPGPGHLAAERHHLMPQHKDFRVFGRLAATQQDQPAEHPDHDQVHQTDRHEPRSCLNPPIPPNRTHGGLSCQEAVLIWPGDLLAGRRDFGRGLVLWLFLVAACLCRRAVRGQAGAPAAGKRPPGRGATTNELEAGKRRPIIGSEEEPLRGSGGSRGCWLVPGCAWLAEWSHMHPSGAGSGLGAGAMTVPSGGRAAQSGHRARRCRLMRFRELARGLATPPGWWAHRG